MQSFLLRTLASLVLLLAAAGVQTAPGKASPGDAWAGSPAPRGTVDEAEAASIVDTAFAYVVQFYPLWFTYGQSQIAPPNRFAGPENISPIYHIVVAINDDTLYASGLLDLHAEPVVVTIPPTTANYSILTVDAYGDIFKTNLMAEVPGTYALTGPGFSGTLPAGLTPVPVRFNFLSLIFRADRFSPSGDDQNAEANAFREALRILPLSQYIADPNGGATTIFPEIYFAQPFKSAADNLVKFEPIRFLMMLQQAVASSNTPPLSPYEQGLVDTFNGLFGDGRTLGPIEQAEFAEATRMAHAAIVDRYLSHTGPTNWISFTNIGDWGDQVIERSAITEFIQYGNGYDTAAYYQTFKDQRGTPLDGSQLQQYVVTFPAGMLPEASRFWSITAYTPNDIELVGNTANKYLVASYTPGLEFNADGSLSVYLSVELPQGKPMANWLPVPPGPFNIMLRVYGPEGSVKEATYVPPPVETTQRRLIPRLVPITPPCTS
jgi:hypothetical protein